MKYLFLFLAILFVMNTLSAHEEPAKTLAEKHEKEKQRIKMMNAKIKSIEVLQYKIEEGKQLEVSPSHYYTESFDEQGHLTSMVVFKNADSIDYVVSFKYDEQHNMLIDEDSDPDGNKIESIEYVYDEEGRVKRQINYKEDRSIDSRFSYSMDPMSQELVLKKYLSNDSIEYQIVYRYNGDPDQAQNTEIIKETYDGRFLMRVENEYNDNNQRIIKRVFDENEVLLYYFEYQYAEDEKPYTAIIKHAADGEIITKTDYIRSVSGFISKVKITDAAGKLISSLIFDYQYR
jgi:hypothetical protein